MRRAIVVAVLVAAVLLAPGLGARSTPQTIDGADVQISFSVTVWATGLTPGDKYAATYTSTYENGRTYTLGYAEQTVKPNGTIVFPGVTLADVAPYGYSGLEEVSGCLTAPGSLEPLACRDYDLSDGEYR